MSNLSSNCFKASNSLSKPSPKINRQPNNTDISYPKINYNITPPQKQVLLFYPNANSLVYTSNK